MNINRLSSVILFTIILLFFLIPPSSAQDILATKRGIVKLMKAVHEREMVVYGSIRWLYTYGSLEWVYNSTTTWTRYTTDGTIPATTKDPPLDWLDGENYPLNTQYITDLYNATRNLVGSYYKYDPGFAPLYFRDYTIEDLPPTEEPAEALQSISDTLKKLEWVRLSAFRRGSLNHDGANWNWSWGSVYASGALSGSSSGYPWYGSVRYRGSYTPAFIPLLVPENLQSDLTIIFHFDYSEWCNPDGQCYPMWYSFSKGVSVETGGGGCPQEPPQNIPVDIKMDIHQGYSVEESPDNVHGENIWEHDLTNASEDWSSSVDCIRWGGIAGRRSWYRYSGDEWTGSSAWYGWTSRWKYFYNRVDIGDVDSDTWLTLYQEPLILRRSYPQDIQPTETSAGKWYSASTGGNLTLDRIAAHIKFEYPGEISFVTEREEWCGDGCLYPRIEIGSSANLSNGNLYDNVDIGNLTLSYNSLLNYTGPLGNNWTHNYNIQLNQTSGTSVTLLDEDGTSIKFTDDNNDNVYESEARFGEYSTIIKNNDATYTLTRKYGTIYFFNPDGKLTKIEDRNSRTTSLIYTGDNLTTIQDPYSRETHFTYEGNRITLITFPGERDITFGYDTGGNLTTITKPEGEIWQYSYDTEGKMVTKTSPNGTITAYTHDDKGKLTSSQAGSDLPTLITYDESNNRAIVRNPLGNTTTYLYDRPKNVWTEITDIQGNTVYKTWDESRNNLTSTDEAGSTTTNTYDNQGNLLITQDPAGNQTAYRYEPVNNQITSETDALGNVTVYNYDGEGNRTSITDPLNNTTQYTYDGRGQLVTTTDPKGNVTTNIYDEYGNVNSVTDAVGNTTHYTYDITGNLITSEDAIGNITQYEYDTADRLLMVSLRAEGEAISTTYTYDELGNRLTQTDAQGNTTRFIYDYKNRLIEVTDPQDNKTTHTYDSTGNRLSTRDARGNTTTFTYDSLNRQISQTNPEGKTTQYEYDTRGNRTKVIDPDGNTTTSTYDTLNRLVSTQDALGNQTSYTYDAAGKILTQQDTSGTISYEYDSLGRTVQVTDQLGSTTQYTYDEVGNRISETDSEGRATHYTYDNLNRLVEETDPVGKKTTYTYDANGNRTSIRDHLGNTWRYEYDSLNQLISETDPQGNTTKYTYDANGNKTSITDPLGRITRYTYNSLNQLITITDPLNGTTSFTYDARGNRASIQDANGHTRRFIYDTLNRLIQEIDHVGNTTTYTYDARGNLVSKTTPNGNTITYTYDNLNRLTTKTLPDGETETNTYDKLGNLIRQENSKTTIENTYDKKNRLISQTITQLWQDGSQTVRTIQYEYDTLGNRTQMIDPEGGVTVYTYDPLTKNLISITNPEGKTTIYTYDTLSRRIKTDYLNKTLTEYTYDTSGRIILLTNYDSSGKIISSHGYTYDKASNRINMTTMDKTIDYTYDGLNRLTGASVQELLSKENWWINYTYDKVGNRTNMTINSTKSALPWNEYSPTLDQVPFIKNPMQVTYNYNELDQLTYEFGYEYGLKIGWGSPYEIYYDYDADGNLNEKTVYKGWAGYPDTSNAGKVTTYTYDTEDRLTNIHFPNNQTNNFYDCFCGAKQMEWTDANGEITRYFLDGDQVLFEYDGNNQIKARYTKGPGIDEKISLTRYNSKGEKTTYYYHYDALGSVVAMTDSTGKLVETYDYDPFGTIIDHQKNVTKNLYTFTGRNYIPDAGIYYYRNRYYDPRVGRFGQIDPLVHQPSVNQNIFTTPEHPYVYVNNNPINFTDPTGLVSITQLNTFDIRMEPGGIGRTDVDIYYYYRRSTDINNPRCCKIKFMQITRKNSEQWFVDGNPWYPNQKPYDYGDPAPQNEYAKMEDSPGGWWLLPSTIQEFETCAICVSGSDKGINYGGISWWHLIEFGRVVRVWPGTKSGLRPEAPSYTFRILTGY